MSGRLMRGAVATALVTAVTAAGATPASGMVLTDSIAVLTPEVQVEELELDGIAAEALPSLPEEAPAPVESEDPVYSS